MNTAAYRESHPDEHRARLRSRHDSARLAAAPARDSLEELVERCCDLQSVGTLLLAEPYGHLAVA